MSHGVLTRLFPFSAIKGMEDVKKALACTAVDDDLKGVLIKGSTGTAKSVLVRSFVDLLPDKDIVNIPLNVSNEQLFGGMDLEHAIQHGKTVIKDGLLRKADRNILYLDNVNLFDRKLLSSIMDCVETGKVIIEREGISAEYECRTTVIATMDPAERTLPDHILDRFNICVQTYSVQNEEDRCEIITLNLDFDSDQDFAKKYVDEDEHFRKSIVSARARLKNIPLTRSDLSKISQTCISLDVVGHRGDISIARVARSLAALDERDEVSDNDIKDAAVMCLLHRRTAPKEERRPAEEENPSGPEEDVKDITELLDEDSEERLGVHNTPEVYEPTENDTEGREYGGGIGTENIVSEITDAVKDKLDDMDRIEYVRLHEIAGTDGRRSDIYTRNHSGRYRSSRIPDGRSSDPAFDATVRAAAPFQSSRKKRGLSIAIEPQDIRDKIRVKRDSCSFLFAIDVSGSLVDSGMMQDIKDGVKAMLMEGYVQRDKVALLTFRFRTAQISVPFTRSLENIYEVLDNTTTGGGTPLGTALLLIREYMLNYVRKNPEERCYIILITDGEATEPAVRGSIAPVELKKITATMNIPNTEWTVVDSSLVPGKVNHALKLAEMLDGRYIRLEDLKSV
jgi:Mg-chelatase subunit ChlI